MLILLLCFILGFADIVFPPASKEGPVKLAIFLPGGKVPALYYNKTVKAIQQHTNAQLWIAIADFSYLGNLCIVTGPLAVKHQVSSAISAASKQSGVSFQKEDIVIMGHSLGTTCANFLRGDGYFAFALFGGCAPYKNLQTNKEPTFCLTGELDLGMIPTMWSYYLTEVESLAQKSSLEQALKQVAIGLVPRMCHLDFCPGFYDTSLHFTSELDPEEATNQIGVAVSSWLHIQFGVQDDMDILMKYWQNSQDIIEPFRKAAKIQNSSWCGRAQQIMTHPSEDQWSRISINDTHLDIDNQIQLEHVHTSIVPSADKSSFVINVGSMTEYPMGRSLSVSQGLVLFPVSGTDVACKMVSRDLLGESFGEDWAIDKTCRDVNVDAIEIATELLAGTHTLERYERIGKSLKLLNDSSTFAGPQWCLTKMGWNEKDNFVEVQSVTLVSPVTSSIFPGNHYCKLLSPARVVEWAMSFGLPKNVSAFSV